MQPREEALVMLADRGEDLPTDVLIARLEVELDAAVGADRADDVRAGGLDSVEPSPVSVRGRVARPVVAIALAAVAVLAVVAAATLVMGRGGDDVPPVDTTVVERGLYDVLRVTFDGSGCSVEGPGSISAATIVPVVLTNTSSFEVQVELAVLQGHIVTGEERTFEDFAELQRAAGGVLWDDPDNLTDSPANWLWPEPLSFNRSAYWLAPTLAGNESLKVYQLSPEVGSRVVFVTSMGPLDSEHRINPDGYWFCAPVEVTPIEF